MLNQTDLGATEVVVVVDITTIDVTMAEEMGATAFETGEGLKVEQIYCPQDIIELLHIVVTYLTLFFIQCFFKQVWGSI